MAKKRWWGSELAKLRADYENPELLLVEVAKKNRTSIGGLARLARQHGWKARYISPRNPKLSAMKQRKRVLEARIEGISTELRRLDLKIRFLENLNAGSPESLVEPGRKITKPY